MSIASLSEVAELERDGEIGAGRTVIAEMPVNILTTPKKPKQQAPQEAIDEFWDKFTTKAPGKATTVIPHNQYIQKAVENYLQNSHEKTTQASYDEAAAVCKAKVAKIVKECRRINQKYRDPHFDLELDLKLGRRETLESLCNEVRGGGGDDDDDDDDDNNNNGSGGGEPRGSRFRPRSVKRVVDIFDEPKFYIDGPTANDVRQGRDGDCWLLAALCTLSNKPSLIERVCVARDEQVGVYGFVFHRDGEWISEIIDDKLFLTKPDFDESFLERMLWEDRERVNSEEQYRRAYQSGSGALYFAQCEHADETWLPLLEKAYAKAHGDYAAIEGGFTGEGIEDLTGGVTSELYTTDILDKEYFWREELMKVNDQFLFGCNTDIWGAGGGYRNGIVEVHAYSVMRAVEMDGQRLVLLKNPWGKFEWKGPWSDGSKEWTAEWLVKLNHRFGDDGAFWISYGDLLRKYQAFDRTRLFGPEWKVTSLWTTLSVPWTLDYHDTHFAFTLARAGPVVLVLSQLDDRYYRGLEGQYWFKLNFRLHRVGQEDYVVRTISPYCQSRSVNVELELEAGEYAVLLKIGATRDRGRLPIEKVVRANARDRRDKLVAVGMSYDLAHSKGRVAETAEERRARRDAERRRRDGQRDELRKAVMRAKHIKHYFAAKDREKELERRAKAKARREAKKAAKEAARAERARAKAERKAEKAGKAKAAADDDDDDDDDADAPEHTATATDSPRGAEASSSEPGAKTPSTVSNESPAGDVSPKTEKAPEIGTARDSEKAAAESEAAADDGKSSAKEAAVTETGDKGSASTKDKDTATAATTAKPEGEEQPSGAEEGEEGYSSEDIPDLSSVSDVSDRELDIELEQMAKAARRPAPGAQQQRQASDRPGSRDDQEPDEFESDPWNAVATVGLRVYHKVSAEDQGKEIVRLRVVRPNPYPPRKKDGKEGGGGGGGGSDNEEEDEDEDRFWESKDKAKGKEKEGKGKEKEKEKDVEKMSQDEKEAAVVTDETKSSQGLDVDDSSKDATLVGDQEQRRKSILSRILPKQE